MRSGSSSTRLHYDGSSVCTLFMHSCRSLHLEEESRVSTSLYMFASLLTRLYFVLNWNLIGYVFQTTCDLMFFDFNVTAELRRWSLSLEDIIKWQCCIVLYCSVAAQGRRRVLRALSSVTCRRFTLSSQHGPDLTLSIEPCHLSINCRLETVLF